MPKKNKSNEPTDLVSKLISKEMVSYIIVNNDLNMSKGKIASQVAHGILDVHRFLLSKNISHDQWSNNGEKIVVVKTGQSNILNIYRQFQDQIPEKNTFNVFPIYILFLILIPPFNVIPPPFVNDVQSLVLFILNPPNNIY